MSKGSEWGWSDGRTLGAGTTVSGAVMAAVLTSRTMELGPGLPAIPTQGAFELCFLVGALAAFAGAMVALLVPPRDGAPAADNVADDDLVVAPAR